MPRRRDFIRTLAAGITVAAYGQEQEAPAEPEVVLRLPERPTGVPTLWIGAMTPTSAVVKTKLPPNAQPRLIVRAPGGAPFYVEPLVASEGHVVTFTLSGLTPATQYTATLEIRGKPSKFPAALIKTFPGEGQAASFAFAFGSCARTGSQHSVFRTMLEKQPALLLHIGDLHYANIATGEPKVFRAAWDTVLSSSTQGPLYRSVPLAYVWDDHDFGPNDSDIRSPSRSAARAVYREYAPHYPLPFSDGPICQAFSVGRVRFIMTDLRSERMPAGRPDGPGKSLLGTAQKTWLKEELLIASKTHALVFLTSSVPWIGDDAGEYWAAFAHERAELCDFMAENRIHNVCILCGDAHMLAADDGTHSDYSASKSLRLPVLHGSAFDQGGSEKGGPYSQGTHPSAAEEGCFGWVEVMDDGAKVTVDFTGRNQADDILIAHRFSV